MERTPFWSRRGLIGITVGLPMVEAALLLLLRVEGGLSLAGQVSGLGPYGVFHDLRWLIVAHSSVLTFVLGLVVLLGLRSLVTAAVVRLAWPTDRPAPPLRRLLIDASIATAVAVVTLSPWVALLFGAAVVPLSWVFFGALPPALLTMMLLHHAGVARDWWRRLPAARSIAWVGIAFAGLTVGGLAVAGRPGAAALPIVALTGLFNAWVWERSVRALVVRPEPAHRPSVPATVVALIVLLGLVVGGSGIGFALFEDDDAVAAASRNEMPGEQSMLIVPGFASACCRDAQAFARRAEGLATIEQFSYLGVDGAGRPRAHAGDATDGDLAVLAARMQAQVDSLASRAGGPITIVAESEGTLIAATYLEMVADAPVDRIAFLSPIVAPGRAAFPAPGEDGPGVVGGYQLRAMVALLDGLSSLELSADGPLSRSLRERADLLAGAAGRDRPAVDELVVLPLADAVTSAPNIGYEAPVVVVAGFHGGLRGRPNVQDLLLDWMQGRPVVGSAVLASLERLIAGGASSWHVPDLGG
jgi:hypothetical protein